MSPLPLAVVLYMLCVHCTNAYKSPPILGLLGRYWGSELRCVLVYPRVHLPLQQFPTRSSCLSLSGTEFIGTGTVPTSLVLTTLRARCSLQQFSLLMTSHNPSKEEGESSVDATNVSHPVIASAWWHFYPYELLSRFKEAGLSCGAPWVKGIKCILT